MFIFLQYIRDTFVCLCFDFHRYSEVYSPVASRNVTVKPDYVARGWLSWIKPCHMVSTEPIGLKLCMYVKDLATIMLQCR